MYETWKLQDAKARFSELVDRALTEGPQHVTRRGAPTVVVISELEYEKSKQARKRKRKSLIEVLQNCPAPEIFDVVEEGRRAPDFGREMEALVEKEER